MSCGDSKKHNANYESLSEDTKRTNDIIAQKALEAQNSVPSADETEIASARDDKRRDIHRPSSPDFDPQSYRCVGVFDNDETYALESIRQRKEQVARLVKDGYKFGYGSSSRCGHCGHHIGYGALMVRDDVKEFIFVGSDCLDNRFELTQKDFQRLRKERKLNKYRETVAKRREEFLANNPDMKEILEIDDPVFSSMKEYLQSHGELSERQVSYARQLATRQRERAQKQAEWDEKKDKLISEGVKAPSGKNSVEGTILSIKTQETAYGLSTKMLVESDEGWKVWVSVPRALLPTSYHEDGTWADGAHKGDKVKFNADLTPSDDDPLFAFGKRPTKAEITKPVSTDTPGN